MSLPARATAGTGRLDRLGALLLAPDAVALRHVTFTVGYTAAWGLVALLPAPAQPPAGPAGSATLPWLGTWLGLALVLGVQAAGALLPWARIAAAWQSVLPLVQMGALVALQHPPGPAGAYADGLLLLPVLTLGLRGTWPAVVLATAGTVGVQLGVALGEPFGTAELTVPRTVVLPALAFLVALGTAAVARQVRTHPAGAAGRVEATGGTARQRDESVGALGHDLRSPLTSVLGYTQLLGAGPLTAEQHGYTDVVARNARRLLRLIDELLLSVQLSAGALAVTHEDVDLAQVTRACRDELGPAARAAGVSLTVTAPGPVPVSGDPDLLAQAVTTVLDSAIRRTLRGGVVTAQVGLRAGRPTGGRAAMVQQAMVEVVDTGAGIEPTELDRFTRAHHRAPGTGAPEGRVITLGLPVAQGVVEAHGGTMDVRSAVGTGTRVRVTLPAGAGTRSSLDARSTPR